MQTGRMRASRAWSNVLRLAVCAALVPHTLQGHKRASIPRRGAKAAAIRRHPVKPKPPPIPTAPELLQRVLLWEEQVPFTAVQTIVLPSGQNSQAAITGEIHLGKRRSRIEYRVPRVKAGQIIITDGRWRSEIRPRTHVMVRTPESWTPTTWATAEKVVHRIQGSYALRVDPRPTAVSGLATYVLEIKPLLGDRNRHVWWVDKKTSLVLKREEYDPKGLLSSVTTYSNVNYHVAPSTAATAVQPPPGLRVVTLKPQPLATTLEAARRIAPKWAPVPRSLGRGFEFESAEMTKVKGAPTLHLHYSDGLVGVSLFYVQGRATVRPGDQPSRQVHVKAAPGTITHQNRYTILSWTLPGHTVNLVADLAESALLDIARRLP